MTPLQCLHHFGSQRALARAIGVSEPSVSLWFTANRIPALSQLRIEEATLGVLRADRGIPRGWCRPMAAKAK